MKASQKYFKQSLKESHYSLYSRLTDNAVILKHKIKKEFELWFESVYKTGHTIDIDGKAFEFSQFMDKKAVSVFLKIPENNLI